MSLSTPPPGSSAHRSRRSRFRRCRVLREAQVTGAYRVERGDSVPAGVEVADVRPAGLVDRLLSTVADGSELLVLGHAVELAEGGQLRGHDAPDRLVEDDGRDVVRVVLLLVVEGSRLERAGVELGLRGVHGVERDVDLLRVDVAVCGGQEDGR